MNGEQKPERHGKIAVVIPYFQREAGILKLALESIFLQQGDFSVDVFVVDDGAPAAVDIEIQSAVNSSPDRFAVHVIKQSNAGPGAARNRGLDLVTDEHEFVAFLDSDDQWLEGHLANAIRALQLGYDFYFSDFLFSDFKEESAFNRAKKLNMTAHRNIDTINEIFEYNGNMTDQICTVGNVIGTSNVVFRHSKIPHQRFRIEFFNGQDYLFWLDTDTTDPRICFSTRLECDCGKGINIYAGAGWGTEHSLIRLKNEIFLWTFVKRTFSLTEFQLAGVEKTLAKIRESIVRDLLHRLTHFKPFSLSTLAVILKSEPSLLIEGPLIFSKIILNKIVP